MYSLFFWVFYLLDHKFEPEKMCFYPTDWYSSDTVLIVAFVANQWYLRVLNKILKFFLLSPLFVWACLSVCLSVCLCLCLCAWLCVCPCTSVYLSVCVCVCVCVGVCGCVWVCVWVCVFHLISRSRFFDFFFLSPLSTSFYFDNRHMTKGRLLYYGSPRLT